ncbi:hypothetical protein GJ496_001963 [Pomphorhynchus laevis]|nr:hypothetical protein GJ496_001963 [Pomphorhynchus laevis]
MTGLLAGIGKLAIARFILQRMVKHPAMRLAQKGGDFEFLAYCYNIVIRNRAQFHIGSAFLTGETRLNTADHIQSRVLRCLGAFSPAVNGPGGKRFASYEDYDSEFA